MAYDSLRDAAEHFDGERPPLQGEMSRDFNETNNRLSAAILEAGRLEELLEELGLSLTHAHGQKLRVPCLIHGGKNKALVVATDGHSLPVYWSCYRHHCEKEWVSTLMGLVRGCLSQQEQEQLLRWLKEKLPGTMGNACQDELELWSGR